MCETNFDRVQSIWECRLANCHQVGLSSSPSRCLDARTGAVAMPALRLHNPYCGTRLLSLIPFCNKTDITKRPQTALLAKPNENQMCFQELEVFIIHRSLKAGSIEVNSYTIECHQCWLLLFMYLLLFKTGSTHVQRACVRCVLHRGTTRCCVSLWLVHIIPSKDAFKCWSCTQTLHFRSLRR